MSAPDIQDVTRRGLDALGTGREDVAIDALERALASAPNDARGWQTLGLLHRERQDMAAAIAAFNRAAALAPSDVKIALGQAMSYLDAGLPSIDHFTRANQIGAGGEGLLGLVDALVAEGRIDIAIQGLAQVLAERPAWVPGLAAITHLRWQAGDRERFVQDYERALTAHPGAAPLWHDLIYALIHAGLYERADEAIARAGGALGEQEFLVAAKAASLADSGRAEQADPLFGQLRESASSAVQLRRVRHFLQRNRPSDAATLAERWVASESGDQFWPYLSLAWRILGDPRWQWLEGDELLIATYNIADRLPPLDTLAATLRALHNTVAQPLTHSLRGGTQTTGNLLSRVDPVIQHLRRAIEQTVAEHVAQLPPSDPAHPILGAPRAPIQFDGSWSVRLTGGGRHNSHVHPKGLLSSALYVALPPGMGKRGDPREGWLHFGTPQDEMGLSIDPYRWAEPKPGRLALFPSIAWHGTAPIIEGERLTVAFDVRKLPRAA